MPSTIAYHRAAAKWGQITVHTNGESPRSTTRQEIKQMTFREYTLGPNGVYRLQQTVKGVHVIDLTDRHTVEGKFPSVHMAWSPKFQLHVQGANETAPTVYVAEGETL